MTPEQEEQVRRALAAAARGGTAGDPQPAPPDVVARLDSVLDGLVAERAAEVARGANGGSTGGATAESNAASTGGLTGEPPAADDLARRRRARRRLLPLAAAACLATLVGATVATGGLGLTGGGGSSTTAADSGAESAPGQGLAGTDTAPAPSSDSRKAATRAWSPPAGQLQTATLSRDVRRLLDGTRTALPAREGPARLRCEQPVRGPGDRLLDVRLDGRPAVLLVRAPVSGRRSAEVFGCRDAAPLAEVTVPAR